MAGDVSKPDAVSRRFSKPDAVSGRISKPVSRHFSNPD